MAMVIPDFVNSWPPFMPGPYVQYGFYYKRSNPRGQGIKLFRVKNSNGNEVGVAYILSFSKSCEAYYHAQQNDMVCVGTVTLN